MRTVAIIGSNCFTGAHLAAELLREPDYQVLGLSRSPLPEPASLPFDAGSPRFSFARLDVEPITGRPHQIRAHLAFAGLPIVGDPKYGVRAPRVSRPMLHARVVEFRHPVRRELVRVEAPVPWTLASVRALVR